VSDAVDWAALTQAAREASERAYCPYSKFPVGAALLSADGRIFTGCNVENVSFGLTICAERNAIFGAVAQGAREFVALVVFTPTRSPVTPCGACRQVIGEFGRESVIHCHANGDDALSFTAGELLPHGFGMRKRSEPKA
jgi:cytidine deaminase